MTATVRGCVESTVITVITVIATEAPRRAAVRYTSLRGIPRAPRDGLGRPAKLAQPCCRAQSEGEAMGEPKTRQFHARVSGADYERTANLAKSLGISQAELVRLLMQLPIEDIEQENVNKFVVLDLATADRMYRELRHWGYQRNQGVHALNSIAYYLRLNKLDGADVMDGYALVHERFDIIEKTAAEISPKIDEIARARFLFR
jgi:hypothetical protein